MKMPFGKHVGEEIAEIPETYLIWLWENVELRSRDLIREIAEQIGEEPEDHFNWDKAREYDGRE